MDTDELKKILAGLAIAGLITGSTLSLSGCAAKSAGSGEKIGGAGSSQSGCTGSGTGAGGTEEEEQKPAKSG